MRRPVLNSILTALLLLPVSALSATVGDALYEIRRAEEMTDKYPPVEMAIPDPAEGTSGKYLSPYTGDEYFTEWIKIVLEETRDWQVPDLWCRERTTNTTYGMSTNDVAGFRQSRERSGATDSALRSCHQFEAGKAAGGWDIIREQSDLSYDRIEDFAVYLHAVYGQTIGYPQVLAIMMSIYPDLERRYANSVMRAYVNAMRSAD